MYADYQYYKNDYLLGRNPVIHDENDFDFFERMAEKEINNQTFGRITKDPAFLSADVRNCTCAVTEFLYKCDTLDDKNYQTGGGQLVSFSNDGDSGAYDVSQSDYISKQAREKKINSLVSFYLSGTGLLYRGVV